MTTAHDLDALALALVRDAFARARGGDAPALAALLDRGVPPDVRNERGDTLLMLASYHGHQAATRLLLGRGADPERANDRGQTPLQGAAFKGDAAIAALLADAGARVDGDDPARTPLAFARMFGRDEVARLLLARGAHPGAAPHHAA